MAQSINLCWVPQHSRQRACSGAKPGKSGDKARAPRAQPNPYPSPRAESHQAVPSPSHTPASMSCRHRLLSPLPAHFTSGRTKSCITGSGRPTHGHQNDRRRENAGSPSLTGFAKYESVLLLGLHWPSAADAQRRDIWVM